MIILSDFGETAEIRGSPDEKFSQAMENFKKSERKWMGRVDIWNGVFWNSAPLYTKASNLYKSWSGEEEEYGFGNLETELNGWICSEKLKGKIKTEFVIEYWINNQTRMAISNRQILKYSHILKKISKIIPRNWLDYEMGTSNNSERRQWSPVRC